MQHLLCMRHASYYSSLVSGNVSGENRLMELTDWFVATGCSNHDCQNALKWSLAPFLESAEVLKDLYIVVESLRNAFGLLVRHLKHFLAASIAFSDVAMNSREAAPSRN